MNQFSSFDSRQFLNSPPHCQFCQKPEETRKCFSICCFGSQKICINCALFNPLFHQSLCCRICRSPISWKFEQIKRRAESFYTQSDRKRKQSFTLFQQQRPINLFSEQNNYPPHQTTSCYIPENSYNMNSYYQMRHPSMGMNQNSQQYMYQPPQQLNNSRYQKQSSFDERMERESDRFSFKDEQEILDIENSKYSPEFGKKQSKQKRQPTNQVPITFSKTDENRTMRRSSSSINLRTNI